MTNFWVAETNFTLRNFSTSSVRMKVVLEPMFIFINELFKYEIKKTDWAT